MVQRSLGTALAALLVLLCAGPAQAATKVVSFDDQPPGTTVDTEYQSSARCVLPGL